MEFPVQLGRNNLNWETESTLLFVVPFCFCIEETDRFVPRGDDSNDMEHDQASPDHAPGRILVIASSNYQKSHP